MVLGNLLPCVSHDNGSPLGDARDIMLAGHRPRLAVSQKQLRACSAAVCRSVGALCRVEYPRATSAHDGRMGQGSAADSIKGSGRKNARPNLTMASSSRRMESPLRRRSCAPRRTALL